MNEPRIWKSSKNIKPVKEKANISEIKNLSPVNVIGNSSKTSKRKKLKATIRNSVILKDIRLKFEKSRLTTFSDLMDVLRRHLFVKYKFIDEFLSLRVDVEDNFRRGTKLYRNGLTKSHDEKSVSVKNYRYYYDDSQVGIDQVLKDLKEERKLYMEFSKPNFRSKPPKNKNKNTKNMSDGRNLIDDLECKVGMLLRKRGVSEEKNLLLRQEFAKTGEILERMKTLLFQLYVNENILEMEEKEESDDYLDEEGPFRSPLLKNQFAGFGNTKLKRTKSNHGDSSFKEFMNHQLVDLISKTDVGSMYEEEGEEDDDDDEEENEEEEKKLNEKLSEYNIKNRFDKDVQEIENLKRVLEVKKKLMEDLERKKSLIIQEGYEVKKRLVEEIEKITLKKEKMNKNHERTMSLMITKISRREKRLRAKAKREMFEQFFKIPYKPGGGVRNRRRRANSTIVRSHKGEFGKNIRLPDRKEHPIPKKRINKLKPRKFDKLLGYKAPARPPIEHETGIYSSIQSLPGRLMKKNYFKGKEGSKGKERRKGRKRSMSLQSKKFKFKRRKKGGKSKKEKWKESVNSNVLPTLTQN